MQLKLLVQIHRVIVPFLTLSIVQDRRLGTDRSTGSDVNVVALQDGNESTTWRILSRPRLRAHIVAVKRQTDVERGLVLWGEKVGL